MSYTLYTDKTWRETQSELSETMRKWRISDWNLITDKDARGRMLPRVTLHYVLRGREVRLTMTKQARAEDNLRALYLSVEDMRMLDVRGLSDVVAEAYMQLAAPQSLSPRSPEEVLGVRSDAPRDVIEAAYRALAKVRHPDMGGSDAAMAELTAARDALLAAGVT